MVSSPSEITPLTSTANCSSCYLTSVSSAVRSPWLLLSRGRVSRISSERQSRTTKTHFMPHIRLQPIEGQDDVSLLLQPRREPRLVSGAQGDQFLIAVHQMRHTALSNTDTTCQEA